MALPLAFGIFFVVWWITLFAVLPFGVKTQQENETVLPGSTESAPVTPLLVRKVIATTLIAGVIFAIIYALYTSPSFTLDSIPLLPRF